MSPANALPEYTGSRRTPSVRATSWIASRQADVGAPVSRGEQGEAVTLIDAAFAKTSAITDPGRLTGYGAFLHWPQIKAAMRAARLS